MLCPSCNADAGEVSKFCPSCGTTIARATEGDDYIGKIVDKKYRVEQMIGEGGMGKVYKATQTTLGKLVVLKLLRHSLLSDERTVARFQREAKAASRLNHPNSISILDFGTAEDGALYIAMEFVAGKDLHQILSKEWPLPEARVVRIVSQVLSALSDAHGAGVIHRDLKPENIMVEQRRGEPDFVKVLDFGIAKIQDSAGDEGPALTRAGFVCGTPEYMSPEQARGAQLDHRSDLYAVGVILYQLTTGLLPFESDSAVGFATKHLTEEPPPPSKRRPDARLSPGMERLILKALSKNPADRPQNADAFKAELANVDKERRVASPRRQPAVTPRHVTPAEAATKLTTSPWSAEKTVRAPSPLATSAGEATLAGGPASAPQGSMLAFKIITVVLVAVALGLVVYNLPVFNRGPKEHYRPPDNAPLPNTPRATAEEPARLYEKEIPGDQRDLEGALKLEREGDEAHARGELEVAMGKYKAAFGKSADPAVAFKLGELAYQRDETNDARGWWSRHLRDHSASRARGYIQQVFSDL